MSLSNELISQFVKVTNDRTRVSKETTVYGTVVEDNGVFYVKLDGSDILTPVSTTTNIKSGERVSVLIKNHTATIMGNLSSPSATIVDIGDIGDASKKIVDFEIRLSDTESDLELFIDRLDSSESTISKVLDTISSMVTDENGTSMMKRTPNGWTFNIGVIENTLGEAMAKIENNSDKLYKESLSIDILKSMVEDITNKTASIFVSDDQTSKAYVEFKNKDGKVKIRFTNDSIVLIDGSTEVVKFSSNNLNVEKMTIKDEIQIGGDYGFVFKRRSNGNMGIRWVGDI